MAQNYTFVLAGIIILVFFLQLAYEDIMPTYLLNYAEANQRPWTYITAIFLHADVAHLFSNLFALVLFGLILEKVIGSQRILLLFFMAGITANIVAVPLSPYLSQVLSQPGSSGALGASGAIFGIMGALAAMRPKLVMWVLGVPMPMFVAAFVWAAQDIVGVFAPTGVGNIAHLTGLFIGLVAGFAWKSDGYQQPEPAREEKVHISDEELEAWENLYMKRR